MLQWGENEVGSHVTVETLCHWLCHQWRVIYVWIIITIVTVIVQVIYCNSVMALHQRSIMAINNGLVVIKYLVFFVLCYMKKSCWFHQLIYSFC